jgi:hypothetical protein
MLNKATNLDENGHETWHIDVSSLCKTGSRTAVDKYIITFKLVINHWTNEFL